MVRVRQADVITTEADPFENDLLGRREPVEILTNLFDSIEGPCVLAVDASWGNGKSTFLKIWAQHLRNEKYYVIDFNAWENDFTGEPFVALVTELTQALENNGNKSAKKKIDKAKEFAEEVAKVALSGSLRLLTAGVLAIDPEKLGKLGNSYADERLIAYQEAKGLIVEFKNSLREMSASVSETNDSRPVIVMIDELDRCRPSYAVELLETAKHMFSVDHIIFVLAVNREQLAHSIKVLYGDGFNAGEYLQRFIDINFRLPSPGRNELIKNALAIAKIKDYFNQIDGDGIDKERHFKVFQDMYTGFLATTEISLRRIAQIVSQLGLVLGIGTKHSNKTSFAWISGVALIFQAIDTELYYKFCRGEITDEKVIDIIFDHSVFRELRGKDEGVFFEAVIIIGYCIFSSRESEIAYSFETLELSNSSLWKRYLYTKDKRHEFDREKVKRAAKMLDIVYKLSRDGVEFRHPLQLIEFVSSTIQN